MEVLREKNLVRTPEGLAIWLQIQSCFPETKLPKGVWKHRDPLHKDELKALALVMKDAKARSQPEQDQSVQSQGAAVWTQQLHFAWDVLLAELQRTPGANLHGRTAKRITLPDFWMTIVDGQ